MWRKLSKHSHAFYSIGSNNEYEFEEQMVESTKCQIYVFNSTLIPKKSPAIADRTDFKRWCVGPREVTIDGRTFKKLPAIQAALGHSEIDLLKMDIEGYE